MINRADRILFILIKYDIINSNSVSRLRKMLNESFQTWETIDASDVVFLLSF